MSAYHDTYLNRDIAKLFPQLNTLAYQRFLSMLCHLSGTILNKSDIARALGVSKSLVKLPKGHIRDTGLLHYLLNIDSLEKLYSHPIVGRSFESFVIEEILKGLSAVQTTNWQAYYYRTRHGVEIDLMGVIFK